MATNGEIALAFAPLVDIDDVQPVSEADDACFQELREVLERHGATGRFGVSLLHSHFPVYEGEMLVETCDPVNRTLFTKVVKREELQAASSVETNWRFDHPGHNRYCITQCITTGKGHTTTSHVESNW